MDLAFDDLGLQNLKNIALPIRAYRVKDTPAVALAADQAASDKPSIAVLPFTNLSGDPEHEYLSDGISEDIITALSQFRSLLVIARHSSFAFKSKAVTVQQVGQELHVEYVLGRQRPPSGQPCPDYRAAHRRQDWHAYLGRAA